MNLASIVKLWHCLNNNSNLISSLPSSWQNIQEYNHRSISTPTQTQRQINTVFTTIYEYKVKHSDYISCLKDIGNKKLVGLI
jgi:hypothetical protein